MSSEALTSKQTSKTVKNIRKTAAKTGAASSVAIPKAPVQHVEQVVLPDLPLVDANGKPIKKKGKRSKSIDRTRTKVSAAKAKAKRASSSGASLRRGKTAKGKGVKAKVKKGFSGNIEHDTRTSSGSKQLDDDITKRLRDARGMLVIRDHSADAKQSQAKPRDRSTEEEDKVDDSGIEELTKRLKKTTAKVHKRGISLMSMHNLEHANDPKTTQAAGVEVPIKHATTGDDAVGARGDVQASEDDIVPPDIRVRGKSIIDASLVPADDGMGSDDDADGDPYDVA